MIKVQVLGKYMTIGRVAPEDGLRTWDLPMFWDLERESEDPRFKGLIRRFEKLTKVKSLENPASKSSWLPNMPGVDPMAILALNPKPSQGV